MNNDFNEITFLYKNHLDSLCAHHSNYLKLLQDTMKCKMEGLNNDRVKTQSLFPIIKDYDKRVSELENELRISNDTIAKLKKNATLRSVVRPPVPSQPKNESQSSETFATPACDKCETFAMPACDNSSVEPVKERTKDNKRKMKIDGVKCYIFEDDDDKSVYRTSDDVKIGCMNKKNKFKSL